MGVASEEELEFAEEVGLFLASYGMSRTAGRILGWLLICGPPRQSAPDLVEALGGSKASVSTALRALERVRAIQRVPVPGARREYFQVAPDSVLRMLEARLGILRGLHELAERGLDLIGEDSARRGRLEEYRDLALFLESELPELLQRWREHRRESADGRRA